MVTDDIEDPLEDSLKWRIYLDIFVTCICTIYTFLIGILASLCIVQHYVCPPKRLQLPGNESYKRVAWLKLLAGSFQLLLYFGFSAELIYPCCNMLSVHYSTFLPAIDARLFYLMLSSVAFINRFAQVAFVVKRWQANTTGMWLPSFTVLLAGNLLTIFIGCLVYMSLYNVFTDSVDHCSYLEVDLCNKYSVEVDHNHFHVDFQFISLLRFLHLVHFAVNLLLVAGYALMMCYRGYDIPVLGLHILKLKCTRGSESYTQRKETLDKNTCLAIIAFLVYATDSYLALFMNFPHSTRGSRSSFDSMHHVLNGEYLRLLKSENYYHIAHISDIIGNIRNGRKWNEEVLHSRSDFSNEDYY